MKRFKEGRLYVLQPFVYMLKDFVDTFLPYKSKWYIVNRDLKQGWHGLRNIYSGIIEFGTGIRRLKPIMIFHGFNNFLRGITQVVAALLTLLLRIPFRGLLTAIMGYQKVEKNRGLQHAVKKAKTLAEEIKRYNHDISLLREKKRFLGAPADYLAKHFPKLTEMVTHEIPTQDEIEAKEKALILKSPMLILSIKRNDHLIYKKYRKAIDERKQASNIVLPANFQLMNDVKVDVHTGVIYELNTFEDHLKFFAPTGKKKRLFAGNDVEAEKKDSAKNQPMFFPKLRQKTNKARDLRKEMDDRAKVAPK